MLYYLFDYLNEIDLPGAGLFRFISFRASMALITSLVISMIFGKKIINLLRRKQIGETVRELGLEGEKQKHGTPTMGGIIILSSIIIPVILFGDLKNTYVILMLVTTVWLGIVGFIDDYIKVFKKNKQGLAGKAKIGGQVVLGLIVGLTLYFSNDVVVRDIEFSNSESISIVSSENTNMRVNENDYKTRDHKSTITTLPFVKNNEADYSNLLWFLNEENAKKYSWIVFVIMVIIIITAVSNGANLTDGMDGLCTGTSAIIGTTLGVFAYLSGNIIFANYLKIMYIPFAGELVIFASAFIGSAVGFLWYNSYPAQVFMGDTGSLSIGGIIAVFAIIIRKELLLPLLCGIFLVESLSVMIQVAYFKYTKRKYGEGRRVFLMSPIHHHFHKKGYHESKIVMRFLIVGILLAVLTVVTLKVR